MTTNKEKDTSAEVPTEIVAQNNQSINAETLISQAIDKNIPVENLERLLAFAKEVKAMQAKEQFDKAMAAFQAECPIIKKTKEVKDNSGRVLYAYAPIESIVLQVKELLKEHGFSYSTSMEVLPDGVKVCVKVTHTQGHSEQSCMQVPLGVKTGIMSASQQTAAATTFAKRYSFMNAFGILSGDDDNDGATIQDDTPKRYDNQTGGFVDVKKPSEKQAKLIADLARQKKLTQAGLKEMALGLTPSKLIERLLQYQTPINPVNIDEEYAKTATPDMVAACEASAAAPIVSGKKVRSADWDACRALRSGAACKVSLGEVLYF